jgi:hypothetical protein
MKSKAKMGRPKRSESKKRNFSQNFRLNMEQNNILKKVPVKTITAKWCYLLRFWAENKLESL